MVSGLTDFPLFPATSRFAGETIVCVIPVVASFVPAGTGLPRTCCHDGTFSEKECGRMDETVSCLSTFKCHSHMFVPSNLPLAKEARMCVYGYIWACNNRLEVVIRACIYKCCVYLYCMTVQAVERACAILKPISVLVVTYIAANSALQFADAKYNHELFINGAN